MRYQFDNHPVASAAQALVATLKSRLTEDRKVLWLLSGGSSLNIATLVARELSDTNLKNLSVTLTDERYVPIGHRDENWQQLLDTGFSLPGANLYRPLNGKSRTDTTADFNTWLDAEIKTADFKIGIFGIGTDGHTAGVKPHSAAINSSELVVDFDSDDFERITITPSAIKLLDEAVVQVSGSDKKPQLEQLLSTDLPISDQPAQVLKSLPAVTIYTDINLEA